jgi:hypothetical protein
MTPPSVARPALAALLGFGVAVGLLALWHRFGLAAMPAQPSENYPYTTLIQACLSWPLAGVFAGVSVVVASLLRAPHSYAVGTILPFLIAVGLEVARDSTNHNLMPFEALFYWLPTYLLAWAPAHLLLKWRRSRAEPPPLPPA